MKKEMRTVVYDDEITCYLRPLHEMVMSGISDFGKEEILLFLISALIQEYGQPFESCIPECPQEIEKGVQSIDAAPQTGFSDQSHFINYFLLTYERSCFVSCVHIAF